MIVYLTVNRISKSFYVGITNGKRKGYLGSGTALLDAIKSYGPKNFRRFTLEACEDRIHASEREVFWIERCKLKWPNRKCYNLTSGGENSYVRNSEVNSIISKKLKKYYSDRPELRKKLSEKYRTTLHIWKKNNGGPSNRILFEKDIEYIRREYSSYKKTLTELAKEFGVSVSAVQQVVLLKKGCRGSGNGQAKLREPQVLEIRKLWETGKYLQVEIGDMYGVRDSLISRIVNRKIWKHI